MHRNLKAVPIIIAAAGLVAMPAMALAQDAQAHAAAQSAAASTLPDGFAVIERGIEAQGGAELMKQVKGLRITGSFEMPTMNMTGDIVVNLRAPNSMLVQIELPGIGSMVQGTDGKTAWANQPGMPVQIIHGEQAEHFKRQADFYADIEPRRVYVSAETVGTVEHDGMTCYQVDVVTTDDRHVVLYYDKESGLKRKEMERSGEGSDVYTSEVTLSDFRKVGAYLHAFKTEVKAQGMANIMTYDTIEHDPEFAVGLFDPPGSL